MNYQPPPPTHSNSTGQEQPPSNQAQQPSEGGTKKVLNGSWPSYHSGSRVGAQDQDGDSGLVAATQPAPNRRHSSALFSNHSTIPTIPTLNNTYIGTIQPQHHRGYRSNIFPTPSYAYGTPSQMNGCVSPVPPVPLSMVHQEWLSKIPQSPCDYRVIGVSQDTPSRAASSSDFDKARTRSPSPQIKRLGETSFQYIPLDATQSQIRLLRILPGSLSDIRCEIFETSLGNSPPYIALSYCWGDTDDTRTISVDGCDFLITENLWSALYSFRSRNHAVTVWADAVCIDQSNVDERNKQVKAMTKVYSQAYEVAIWLGPEYEDSNQALQLLERINSFHQAPSWDYNFYDIIRDSAYHPHRQALVCLFERDYWSRLWVVQEVHNAKKIRVYCGSASLPWIFFTTSSSIFRLHLTDLVQTFREKISASGYAWSTILSNHGPARLWDMKEASVTGLLPSLIFHRSKACVDARDKVFGLLGILPLHESSQIIVDYNMSIREVYINVVDYVLRTTGKLNVVCASIHFPWHKSPEALPSWVPDWSQTDAQPPISFLFSCKFTASGFRDARYSFSCKRRRLQISAVPIDEIHICGTHLSPPRSINTILIIMFQWRLRLLEVVGVGSSSIAAHEAFCRTLCLDRGRGQISPRDLLEWTYHTFASLLRERYPYLKLDEQLKFYADIPTPDSPYVRNIIFEDYFADAITGRRFMVTSNGLICLGSGATRSGDVVCVPLGCSTPVILRKINDGYKYVGDIYVDGYMDGKAVEEMESGLPHRQLQAYLLI